MKRWIPIAIGVSWVLALLPIIFGDAARIALFVTLPLALLTTSILLLIWAALLLQRSSAARRRVRWGDRRTVVHETRFIPLFIVLVSALATVFFVVFGLYTVYMNHHDPACNGQEYSEGSCFAGVYFAGCWIAAAASAVLGTVCYLVVPIFCCVPAAE